MLTFTRHPACSPRMHQELTELSRERKLGLCTQALQVPLAATPLSPRNFHVVIRTGTSPFAARKGVRPLLGRSSLTPDTASSRNTRTLSSTRCGGNPPPHSRPLDAMKPTTNSPNSPATPPASCRLRPSMSAELALLSSLMSLVSSPV